MKKKDENGYNARVNTYLILFAFTLGGCYAVWFYAPHFPINRIITLATGYLALSFTFVTLLIGPLKLLSQKQKGRAVRNGVNLTLRRDTGIWVAILACIHVWFGLGAHFSSQIVFFFFKKQAVGIWVLQTEWFGFSNWIGALATALVLGLAVLSNDLTLRWLGGKRWKNLQRLNYIFVILALLHTFGYQIISNREIWFTVMLVILTLLTLIIQCIGIYWYRVYLNNPLKG